MTTMKHPILNPILLTAIAGILAACSSPTPETKRATAAQVGTGSQAPASTMAAMSNTPLPDGMDADKAVWVLPQFSVGYVPAKTDPANGDYIGAHTRQTIVQQGHYATLEEAELKGTPYVVPATNEIVDPRNKSQRTEGRAGTMNLDINPFPAASPAPLPRAKTPEKTVVAPKSFPSVAKQSNESKAVPAADSTSHGKTSHATIPLAPKEEPKENVTTAVPSAADAAVTPVGFSIEHPSASQVVFSGGKAGETHQVKLGAGKSVTVKYVTDTQLEVKDGGNVTKVTLPQPGAQVKLNTK